jgi:thiol-disulfide isomerase/thioredoxin
MGTPFQSARPQGMNANPSRIRDRTVSAGQYINDLEEPFKERYLTTKQTYQLQQEATDKLSAQAHNYFIVAFSSSWCKDCARFIPVLALIEESTGLEVRVFGGLKGDPLSHTSKWRIPPSPPEVLTFNVEKIPLMIVFDQNGTELDRIVESPKRYPTLEQEICDIINRH